MVLDEKSGQVISVGELVKRTQIRCAIEMANGEKYFGLEIQKSRRGHDRSDAAPGDVPMAQLGTEYISTLPQDGKVAAGNVQVEEMNNVEAEREKVEEGGLKRKIEGADESGGECAKRICL